MHWSQNENSFRATSGTAGDILPAGYYHATHDMAGIRFDVTDYTVDDYVTVPGSAAETLKADVEKFLGQREKLRAHGFVPKRGYLLHGQRGTGKTQLCAHLAKSVVELGGISVLIDDPRLVVPTLAGLKRIEPGRLTAIVLEEFDSLYQNKNILSVLDGESALENVIYLCTTNHLEELPPEIVHRPGRFDRVIEIGPPSDAEREVYLTVKLLGDREKARHWAGLTKNFPYSYLSALVRSVECLDCDLYQELKYLKGYLGVVGKSDSVPSVRGGSTMLQIADVFRDEYLPESEVSFTEGEE